MRTIYTKTTTKTTTTRTRARLILLYFTFHPGEATRRSKANETCARTHERTTILTSWLDALTSNMNLGFIDTIVGPDMESERRVHTRLPVSAFQQWIRPSVAPRNSPVPWQVARDRNSPQKTNCASGLNEASMGMFFELVKPCRNSSVSNSNAFASGYKPRVCASIVR